ncbi:MAG: hypothetical protein ACJAU5_000997 [Maricaulis maris]|jgi:hypothetical protein|uniref:Uncharacterized protein n=1 Tax=Maricaulis maris (strain MCS10) TaxID=394221 RepID=Q0AK34_MARMM|nr:hypothetical protein Mmar10_3080 [Maricaulis maris MCS10]
MKTTTCSDENLSQRPSFDPITDFSCQAKKVEFWKLNHVDRDRPGSNLWASEGDNSHAEKIPKAARLGGVLWVGKYCLNYKHIALAFA